MADTITVLDGIQFAKPNTADVYTIDGDGLEAVKSYAISIPPSASGARVIFNGAYDPDGGRYHCRVRYTAVTAIGTLTKTQNTQPLEWTTCTPPAILETGSIDVSGAYSGTLHIDVAMSSTTANTTGIEIIVQIQKEAALDEWTDLTRFIGPTGTAVKSDFVGTNNAAATTLGVTNPVTGTLDHLGKFIFFEDTVTIAQCEIAFLVSQTGD
jgi:hypothetical protein